MLLVKKHIEKDQSGYVTLKAEEDEDMWHAYNLIQEGDEVRASAVRRVVNETSTGSSSSHRVHINLTISVNKVTYSALDLSLEDATTASTSDAPAASQATTGTSLHISGQVTSENPYVKKGAFHTLDLEIGRNFTIIKAPGEWDAIALDRIREVTEPGRGADVGAVVCGEGVANICLVTNHTTIVRQRIDVSIPRKRKGGGAALGLDKANAKFLSQVYSAVDRHFDFEALKVIIIASPGFVKETVQQYILDEAVRTGNKRILNAKDKFLLLHAQAHHVHALAQVLSSPEASSQLKDTKFAREGAMLDNFFKMLENDPLRAWYGEGHVLKAAERGAISKLLISDRVFRSADPARRKRFVKLTEDVRAFGGETLIFSSMHESGQQLNALTGIAAILSFPLDIEVVEEEEREYAARSTEKEAQ